MEFESRENKPNAKEKFLTELFMNIFKKHDYQSKSLITRTAWFLDKDPEFQSLMYIKNETPTPCEDNSNAMLGILRFLVKEEDFFNFKIRVEDFVKELVKVLVHNNSMRIQSESQIKHWNADVQRNIVQETIKLAKSLKELEELNIYEEDEDQLPAHTSSSSKSGVNLKLIRTEFIPIGSYKVDLLWYSNTGGEIQSNTLTLMKELKVKDSNDIMLLKFKGKQENEGVFIPFDFKRDDSTNDNRSTNFEEFSLSLIDSQGNVVANSPSSNFLDLMISNLNIMLDLNKNELKTTTNISLIDKDKKTNGSCCVELIVKYNQSSRIFLLEKVAYALQEMFINKINCETNITMLTRKYFPEVEEQIKNCLFKENYDSQDRNACCDACKLI